MGGAPPTAGADSERLFTAGVTYICCGAWPLAYDCFERSAREDAPYALQPSPVLLHDRVV